MKSICMFLWILGITSHAKSLSRAGPVPRVRYSTSLKPGTYFLPKNNGTDRLIKIVKNLTGIIDPEVEDNEELDFPDSLHNIRLQPCFQYDTCKGRCLDYPRDTGTIAETEHFNCNCDPDCEIFGDCCWDYPDECQVEPRKRESGSDYSVISARPNADAFECVAVDEYSKEHYWVVTRCATTWPNDEIKKRCTSKEADFINLLPVQGDTGWTYKNAFCAQCNHVRRFKYWHINAKCFQNAPDEVLSGSPDMISYYLMHFCNIGLTRAADEFQKKEEQGRATGKEVGIESDSTWYGFNFPLRRCDVGLIRKCPERYEDNFVTSLCEEYQSLVIYREYVDGEDKARIFKNPMCAYCHSVATHIDPHPAQTTGGKQFKSSENGETRGHSSSVDAWEELSWRISRNQTSAVYPTLECPVWLWMEYYDLPYWSLSPSRDTRSMLPKFKTSTRGKSKWTPPSFSMLLQFRQDGSNNIHYTEEGNSTKSITPNTTCHSGEIYDPFYARCRAVLCYPDEVYTGSSCEQIPNVPDQKEEDQMSDPVSTTITLIIEVPVQKQHSLLNSSTSEAILSIPIPDDMQTALSKMYNISATNVTILNITVFENTESTNTSVEEKSSTDKYVTFAFTFVLLNPEDYTDNDIIEFTENVNNLVQFQRLLLEADFLAVVVLSMPRIDQLPLQCEDGTKKLQYSTGEYEIIEYEGRYILHVNETDEYYLESEYQFLDWSVTITENGTQRTYVDNSRVIVCAEVPEVPVCNMYVPLNQSEYVTLEDGSLFLTDRNLTIPPEEYINYGESVAVCIDGYIQNSTTANTTANLEEEYVGVWLQVEVWLTFSLSMISLLALAITFITYILFRDMRTVTGCCIMNLTIAQFSAVAMFMFGAKSTSNPAACAAVAILLHYLFLSIFFWNNVMAFDVWCTFGQGLKNALRRSVQNRYNSEGKSCFGGNIVYKYMLYGWGVPILIVGITVALDYWSDITIGYFQDSYYGICWISNATANIVIFGVPVFTIIVVNAVFFALSIRAIRKSASAPLKNVGNPKPFRRKMASISDEVRNDNTPDLPRCTAYRQHCMSDISRPCSVSSNDAQDTGPPKNVITKNNGVANQGNVSSDITISRKKIKPERRISTTTTKGARSNVLAYVKMSTVMGFSWIIGFAAAFTQIMVLWLLFELSVPLQGISIFWAFTCRRKILKRYKNLLCCESDKISRNRYPSSDTQAETATRARNIRKPNASTSSLDEDVFENTKETKQWRGIEAYVKSGTGATGITAKKDANPTAVLRESESAGMRDFQRSAHTNHAYANEE